jgi:hypothetical protein
LLVQTFVVFMPVSASVLVVNVPFSAIAAVVMTGFVSNTVHFQVVASRTRSSSLFEHDLFGKPVPTFPDHALESAALALRVTADAAKPARRSPEFSSRLPLLRIL